ncbi:hypothetical protein [Caenimonas aquaedulcis]|uniref:Uncharacterized protein n=1 Tax=Caenimonas aquaedulcis TaxID=2793270 RepID=A0A931H6X6_9BURK|nr:hypothetical protein [Caenimonas aquaedulcis]MBG9389796.1 hypothetical protein [Caenimonas aquaedulcis]
MAQSNAQLIPRPCADLPEFQRFVQQAYRKEALMQQTGGGDAFVEAAAPIIRKSVLQAAPYASPTSKRVHELRRMGVPDDVLDRALARAWLDGADEFYVPRPDRRQIFLGTAALLFYSVAIVIVGLIEAVNYLHHAHPDIASVLLGAPPLMAICGVPVVLVIFLLLRKIVHRN